MNKIFFVRHSMIRLSQLLCLLSFITLVACASTTATKDSSVSGVKETKQDPPPFVLGPRDEISVNVWRNDDLKRTVQIEPSGNIQFPLIGEMRASGLTVVQLKEKMTTLLSKYIVDPQVDINITNLKSAKVYVLGEVKAPGTFDWRNGMQAWEGISQAGGFTTDANEENLLLVRNENGKAIIKTLNLYGMLKGDNLTQDVYLRSGDVVYVIPTTIASVQRFMTKLSSIISPIVNLESGIVLYPQVVDVLNGNSSKNTSIIVPGN